VGNVVPVFGNHPCAPSPLDPAGDPLFQHHLPIDRCLMQAQLRAS
jgi:hypothetical protein